MAEAVADFTLHSSTDEVLRNDDDNDNDKDRDSHVGGGDKSGSSNILFPMAFNSAT